MIILLSSGQYSDYLVDKVVEVSDVEFESIKADLDQVEGEIKIVDNQLADAYRRGYGIVIIEKFQPGAERERVLISSEIDHLRARRKHLRLRSKEIIRRLTILPEVKHYEFNIDDLG